MVLRVRRRSCGLLNTGFSGQALLGSISWNAVVRFWTSKNISFGLP